MPTVLYSSEDEQETPQRQQAPSKFFKTNSRKVCVSFSNVEVNDRLEMIDNASTTEGKECPKIMINFKLHFNQLPHLVVTIILCPTVLSISLDG